MPDVDFFYFFRYWLGWIVTIYASTVMLQSLWGVYLTMAGSDKYMTMLRRYLLVHGLRLRFKTFWGDLLICVLLTAIFLMLWRAQHVLSAIEVTLGGVK